MSPTPTAVALHVNGAPHDVPAGSSVEDLLRLLGRDPAVPGVAVAVNDAVVRRARWAETTLQNGDHVEVITASQGG